MQIVRNHMICRTWGSWTRLVGEAGKGTRTRERTLIMDVVSRSVYSFHSSESWRYIGSDNWKLLIEFRTILRSVFQICLNQFTLFPITKAYLHRFSIEHKSWERQTNLKGSNFLISKYIINYTLIKILWYWYRDRHTDQWYRTESPDINSCIYIRSTDLWQGYQEYTMWKE